MCKLPPTEATTLPSENEAALALLMLGGCPQCGKPFRQQKGTLVCCHIAYCPFCARPHTDKCPHLCARSRWGHWSIDGLGMQGRQIPDYPRPEGNYTDYSESDWRTAFGEEWQRYRSFYRTRAGRRDVSIGEKELVRRLLLAFVPEHHHAYAGGQKFGRYVFAHSFPNLKAAVKRFLKGFQEGIDRLQQRPPVAARFLVGKLHSDRWSNPAFGAFSPDGRYLLVGSDVLLQVWKTDDMKVHREWDTSAEGGSHAVVFRDDHTFVYERKATRISPEGVSEYDLEADQSRTVSRMEVASRLKRPLRWKKDKSGLLHAGNIRAFVRGKDILIYRNAGEATREQPPLLTLALMDAPYATAFSPDGEHFVTLSRSGLLLWRITAEGLAAANG